MPSLRTILLLLLLSPTKAFVAPNSPQQRRQLLQRPSLGNNRVVESKTEVKMVAKVDALGQYAPAAISLFNNMKLPATILAGAMIPLGLAAPLKLEEDDDSKLTRILRRIYPVAVMIALSSELISVMWATVTVNQLTENKVPLAASVWDLLRQEYELEWAAVNAHFVLGMFGFMWIIGTRAYFVAQKGPLGLSVAGIASSGLLTLVSIVNRGIAAGGGKAEHTFGGTIIGLVSNYVSLLLKRAVGLTNRPAGALELIAVGLFLVSFGHAVRAIIMDTTTKEKQQ